MVINIRVKPEVIPIIKPIRNPITHELNSEGIFMKIQLPPFTPHEDQYSFLKKRGKRNIVCCGRRWGKSLLAIDILLNVTGGALVGKDGSGKKGLPCAWYAPNYSYLISIFNEIKTTYYKIIEKAPSVPIPTIYFKNGGSIDFWTLDEPMKCGRGKYYARVIIDEAAHSKHLKVAWENTIEFTLADLDGDAFLFSTPFGMNFFETLTRHPDWVYHRAPSFNNPHLPKGWMESKAKTMPSKVYRQEVLAEFISDGAGVFRRVDDLPKCSWQSCRDGKSSYVISVDWGRTNDYTVFTVITSDFNVVNIDRFNDTGYELQGSRLKRLWENFGRPPVIAEANSIGGPMIEKLQREGVNIDGFTTTNASKNQIIEALALAIENGQIALADDPRMEPLKTELISFDQDRTSSGLVKYSAPSGMHDDTVMSLAIGFNAVVNDSYSPFVTYNIKNL